MLSGILPDSSRRFFPSFLPQADAPQTDEDPQACLEKSEPSVGPIRPPQSCRSRQALIGTATPARGKQEEGDHADRSEQWWEVWGGRWWCREQGISPPREKLLHYLVNVFLKGMHLTHPQKNSLPPKQTGFKLLKCPYEARAPEGPRLGDPYIRALKCSVCGGSR